MRLLRRLAALCCLAACATPVQAAKPTALGWPIGFVAGDARRQLVGNWNDHDAFQTERGYCVTADSLHKAWATAGYHAVYVTEVARAHATDSTQETIDFKCAVGQPTVHTHAAYCDITRWGVDLFSCSLHRPEAQQCAPSLPDIASLIVSEAPYAIVQCGPEQFRFYWATDYLWLLKGTKYDREQHPYSGIGSHRIAIPGVSQAVTTHADH